MYHLLAERTPSAKRETAQDRAPVCKDTSGIRTRVVDRSASLIRIASRAKAASVSNARIPALGLAVKMQSAK